MNRAHQKVKATTKAPVKTTTKRKMTTQRKIKKSKRSPLTKSTRTMSVGTGVGAGSSTTGNIVQNADAVNMNEEPDERGFQRRKKNFGDKAPSKKDPGYSKQDNASSHHTPIFAARPLKVNVNNLFDPRADYVGGNGYFTMRFEIDHDGQNVENDLLEKSNWHDLHITNEWFDTMITRYCPHLSKKAKQMKPSNERQLKGRKLHKQAKEKNLATSIRNAVDNTPRFTVFSNCLAENKQLYGTYTPKYEDIKEYRTSGKEMMAKLQARGQDVDYKSKVLRDFREMRNEADV